MEPGLAQRNSDYPEVRFVLCRNFDVSSGCQVDAIREELDFYRNQSAEFEDELSPPVGSVFLVCISVLGGTMSMYVHRVIFYPG